jgi:hypothetical protein
VSDGLGCAGERLHGVQSERDDAAIGQDSLGWRGADVGLGSSTVHLDQPAAMLGCWGVYDVEPSVAAKCHLGERLNCHRGPRRCCEALLFGLSCALARIKDDGLHQVFPSGAGLLLRPRRPSTAVDERERPTWRAFRRSFSTYAAGLSADVDNGELSSARRGSRRRHDPDGSNATSPLNCCRGGVGGRAARGSIAKGSERCSISGVCVC